MMVWMILSDVVDVLDVCLMIEVMVCDDGWDEGVVVGCVMGVCEGWEMGFRKGFEFAEEVGYYVGCAVVWWMCVM